MNAVYIHIILYPFSVKCLLLRPILSIICIMYCAGNVRMQLLVAKFSNPIQYFSATVDGCEILHRLVDLRWAKSHYNPIKVPVFHRNPNGYQLVQY